MHLVYDELLGFHVPPGHKPTKKDLHKAIRFVEREISDYVKQIDSIPADELIETLNQLQKRRIKLYNKLNKKLQKSYNKKLKKAELAHAYDAGQLRKQYTF